MSSQSDQTCAPFSFRQFVKLVPLLRQLANSTRIIWMPQGTVNSNNPPSDSDGGNNNVHMLMYNEAVRKVIADTPDSPILYWQSAWLASLELRDHFWDGIHFGPKYKKHLIHMLLNTLCRTVATPQTAMFRRLPSFFIDEPYDLCCG